MKATIIADGPAGYQARGRVTRVRPRLVPKHFSSDDPAERFDVDTREIWITLETEEPPLVGLRVRVVLVPTRVVAPIPSPAIWQAAVQAGGFGRQFTCRQFTCRKLV